MKIKPKDMTDCHTYEDVTVNFSGLRMAGETHLQASVLKCLQGVLTEERWNTLNMGDIISWTRGSRLSEKGGKDEAS